MKIRVLARVRSAFCLLLVSGLVTAAVATSAKPAEAGVVIAIGFGGGGYAPVYRPYPRPYAHVYRRRYVPALWAAPRIYPAYVYPADRYPAYGRAYVAGYPAFRRPYGPGHARYRRQCGRGYYYAGHASAATSAARINVTHNTSRRRARLS